MAKKQNPFLIQPQTHFIRPDIYDICIGLGVFFPNMLYREIYTISSKLKCYTIHCPVHCCCVYTDQVCLFCVNYSNIQKKTTISNFKRKTKTNWNHKMWQINIEIASNILHIKSSCWKHKMCWINIYSQYSLQLCI